MIANVRDKVRQLGFSDLNVLVVGLPWACALCAGVGFGCGHSIGSCLFWFVSLCFAILALSESWIRLLQFAAIEILLLLLTAFTFSYWGTDSIGCWFPMQWMMRMGWNPVYEFSHSCINGYLAGLHASVDHMFVYPKMVPVVGCCVGKATGIFAADSYLSYSLVFALASVSYRFASRFWSSRKYIAVLFAMTMVFTTKLATAYAGLVDYAVYASFMIVVFAIGLMESGRQMHWLVAVSLCTLISIKANGIVFAMFLIGLYWLVGWRMGFNLRKMVLLVVLTFASAIIINLNPIIPLIHKFVVGGQQWVDVASDFTGNDDAMRLGYFWRIVYAWISPKLVPGNPVFYVCGGVNGFGNVFCVLFVLSAFAIALSRKNIVTIIWLVIFISSQALPLKYVGHARYVPQIWALPALAFFNLAFAPSSCILRYANVKRVAAGCFFVCIFGLTSMCIIRTVCVASNFWRAEHRMQDVVKDAKGRRGQLGFSPRTLASRNTYVLWHRLGVEGIGVNLDSGDWLLDYNPDQLITSLSDAPYYGRILLPDNPKGWIESFSPSMLCLSLPIMTAEK